MVNCNLLTHEALKGSEEIVINVSVRFKSNWNLEAMVFRRREIKSTWGKTSRSN